MSKPMCYKDLPEGSLFRMFAERRVVYERCERLVKMVRSEDRRVYKKHGMSHSSTKDGHDIIPGPSDLVMPFESPNYKGNSPKPIIATVAAFAAGTAMEKKRVRRF